jgi:hypothetical protein
VEEASSDYAGSQKYPEDSEDLAQSESAVESVVLADAASQLELQSERL